jgi:PPOX class probable F420-dependent enzyme
MLDRLKTNISNH